MEQALPTNNDKQTNRPLVLAALVISMFMAAIEGTIIATAMPSIVGELGGFSMYSWAFSSFLLMQAVTTLIYGKLADLFGRKPVFLIGINIFIIGSTLCGLADTMTMLILFRMIQGIGAGAIHPIVTTIVGDMYTMKERAKVQGYLASVWGISSVIGPLFGGMIVKYYDWSWIFWMNIPLGIFGMLGVYFFFHESIEKQIKSIDYLGATFFFLSISALIIVLVQVGTNWAWNSSPVVLLLLLFIVGAVLFIWQENRATSPMMPLSIWNDRLIIIANLATLSSGMIMIGLSSFLPTYVQGVMGYSAIVAGFALSAMSIGWPISATVAGHLVLKIGFRITAILGGVALVFGTLLFVFLTPDKSPIYAGVSSFFVGVGMGLTSTTFIVSIQNGVDWKKRGVATSLNMFMRIIGSALGASFLGGVLNTYMNKNLGENISIENTDMLLEDAQLNQFSVQAQTTLKESLTSSLHIVYLVIFILAVLTLVLTFFYPSEQKKK